jgi:lipopolysaccharide/colanic/teichoic acid biosynthesis glycosyltransferase
MYRRFGKRAFDVAVAVVALVVLCPVLIVLWMVVRLTLGRPAIFRQERPGLGGKPFEILKFRTMRDLRDGEGAQLPDADRLSAAGAFLRSTSLDELPELFNVVRGEMSLVGPRPLLMSYLGRYSPEQARRHEVPPGITGWAQVRGRNLLSWEEKFAHDVWYVEHVGFWLDLRILLATARLVFSGAAISAPGHATMPEFEGRERE